MFPGCHVQSQPHNWPYAAMRDDFDRLVDSETDTGLVTWELGELDLQSTLGHAAGLSID